MGSTAVLPGIPAEVAVDDRLHRAFVYTMPDGKIGVIDTRTGALLRVVTVTANRIGVVPASLAVDGRRHHLFVSSANGNLYMLDTRSGTLLRTIPVADSSPRQVVVDAVSGHGFVGYGNGTVVTEFDTRSGTVLRQLKTCSAPSNLGIDGTIARLFARCDDGYTATVDTRAGRTVGTAVTVGQGSAVLVDERLGRVFESSCDNGTTMLLDARTGALLNTFSFGMVAAVEPGTGRLDGARTASGCRPGRGDLLRVDERTGIVESPRPGADNPLAALINPRTGHLLIASAGKVDNSGIPAGNGIISVINPASGAVLRRVEAGIMPWGMDLDRQAGRLIVLNGYVPFPEECACVASIKVRKEGWWARTTRGLKDTFGWLPFTVSPPPPPAASTGTVTVMDLAQL
jgi:DNA-binding beta-propeller fold protein YncE